MGTVYARGERLWIGYKDPSGKWVYARTDFTVGHEDKARKVLQAVERQVKAGEAYGEAQLGPVTLERYFERWIAERKRLVASAKDDETRLRRHALPTLGRLALREIRALQVRNLVRALKAKCGPGKDQLAPRTVRHVYATLHRLFEDALAEELIEVNPCTLKRGELPAKVDKDPTWRATAVFTREELTALISDARIPEHRRVLYAGIFLTGSRIGEWAARRWRDWDTTLQPLGRLLVATSYSRKLHREKSVKTERPREVPVHPVLAGILAAWRADGWANLYGRAPTPDDLISPSPTGRHLADPNVLERLHADLATLGIRPRRIHDSRRTFISLAQADGARKDVLRWVTHGPTGDIVDLYTTLPWATLCEEVVKLRITLQAPPRSAPEAAQALTAAPQVIQEPAPAPELPEALTAASENPEAAELDGTESSAPEPLPHSETGGALTTRLLHGVSGNEKAPKSQGLGGSVGVPRAGFEPAHLSAPPPQDGVSTSSTTWALLSDDAASCTVGAAPSQPQNHLPGVPAGAVPEEAGGAPGAGALTGAPVGACCTGAAAGAVPSGCVTPCAGMGVPPLSSVLPGLAAALIGATGFVTGSPETTEVRRPTKDRPSEVRKNRPAHTAVTLERNVTAPRPPKALVAAPPPRAAPIPASLPGCSRMTKIMNTHSRTCTIVKKVSIRGHRLAKFGGGTLLGCRIPDNCWKGAGSLSEPPQR